MKNSKTVHKLSNADSVTKDWIQIPSDEIAVNRYGCYFDYEAADSVRQFFRDYCRHSKGEKQGEPFELLEWQWRNFIGPAFGWKLPDGSRRIRNIEAFTPKKNGKSTLCAGIALYLMSGDNEPAAEIYLAASDRGQAGIVFNECKLMVESSEEFLTAFDVRDSKKLISFPDNNSYIQAISREAKRNEGYNIHGLIFDELHTQQNRLLWAALKYGGASRRQAMRVSISTAGELDETSLWWEVFQNAISIANGKNLDIHTWPCVYYMKDGQDWNDEKVWRECNPSYDYTINKVEFKQHYEKALKNSADESEFLRYHLNKATKHESAWIRNHYWTGCKFTKPEQLDMSDCVRITAGLDLADSLDLNAFVINGKRVTQDKKTKQTSIKHIIKPIFWAPEEAGLALNKQNRDRYVKWFESGLLRMIAGPIARQSVVLDDLMSLLVNMSDEGIVIDEIAMDRFQATDFAYQLQALLKKNRIRTKVRLVGYNFVSMNEPTKRLEEIIHGGLFIHDDNEIMNWMFGNVECLLDSNGNRKLNKGSPKGKIDGLAALCMSIRSFMDIEQTKKESKYNNPDVGLSTKSYYGVA